MTTVEQIMEAVRAKARAAAALTEQIQAAGWVAKMAHRGQVDKAGLRMVDHAYRVASRLPRRLQVVGWLHDVLEDTDVGIAVIRGLFGPEITAQVIGLTRVPADGETYQDYIRTIAKDRDLTIVKLADLDDHLRTVDAGLDDPYLPESLEKRYRVARQILRTARFQHTRGIVQEAITRSTRRRVDPT